MKRKKKKTPEDELFEKISKIEYYSKEYKEAMKIIKEMRNLRN